MPFLSLFMMGWLRNERAIGQTQSYDIFAQYNLAWYTFSSNVYEFLAFMCIAHCLYVIILSNKTCTTCKGAHGDR